MALGLIANSKNALLFSGVVIAFAGVVALSLGSHFAPNAERDTREEREMTAVEEEETEDDDEKAELEEEPDIEPEEVYEDFANDAELIDQTNGIDTSPITDQSVILSDDTATEGEVYDADGEQLETDS